MPVPPSTEAPESDGFSSLAGWIDRSGVFGETRGERLKSGRGDAAKVGSCWAGLWAAAVSAVFSIAQIATPLRQCVLNLFTTPNQRYLDRDSPDQKNYLNRIAPSKRTSPFPLHIDTPPQQTIPLHCVTTPHLPINPSRQTTPTTTQQQWVPKTF